MMFALALINVILLCAGCATVLQKHIGGISKPITVLTGGVMTVSLISSFYYLTLVLGLPFWALQLFLLAINVTHVYLWRSMAWLTNVDLNIERPKHTLVVIAGLLGIIIYFTLNQSKYGNWDAWSIWNLHAKFLTDAARWKNMFGPELAYSHPDYPLMLPSFIAYFWKGLGHASAVVPLVFALTISLIIPLVIYYALADERQRLYACAGLLLFAIDNNFKFIATYQGADTLLSLFILLTVVFAMQVKNIGSNSIYLIAFLAASTTWIKNEGWLFFAVFSAFFLISNYRTKGVWLKYALGAAFPLIISLSFKLFFSPPNDLVSAGHQNAIALLTDTSRYMAIAKFMADAMTTRYMLFTVILTVMLVMDRKYFVSMTFLCMLMIFAGYIAIYLTTPYDLKWHLSTSFDRVLQHIYPAMIFSIILSVKAKYDIKEKRDQ